MGHVEDRWWKVTDRPDGTRERSQTARHGTGRRWRARPTVDGREGPARSFDRKADADRYLTTVEAEALAGVYINRADRTTVTEYARKWAAARPHRPTTARRVKSVIDTHIAGTSIGSRRLAAVTSSEVQAWASERARVLSPSTLRNLVSLLRSVYAAAVLDRLVASSPVVRLTLPAARRERIVPLTVEQVRLLAAAMPARNKAMVITQAGLGLRIGELLALRTENVNFLGRSVRIAEQIAPDGRGVRSDVKTPTSRRTIPLPAVVADALAAHMLETPPAPDGTLFTTRFGNPYGHAYYGTKIFKAAVARVPSIPGSTTSHDLRHHYASVLLHAGESVVAVAERLGHENAALVLSTYGHIMPNAAESTRQAIDSAWSGEDVTAPGRPAVRAASRRPRSEAG